MERDDKTGKIARLVESGYTLFKPPEVKTAHQQAYLRFSTDEGRSWSASSKIPQWEAVSEVLWTYTAPPRHALAFRTKSLERRAPVESLR